MSKSVFYELYQPEEAFVLEQKSKLFLALSQWLKHSELNQTQAAEKLGVDQPRVSEIAKGKVSRFTIDKLLMMTNRVGIDAEVTVKDIPHAA